MKTVYKKFYAALISVALTIGAAFVFAHEEPVRHYEVPVNAATSNIVTYTVTSTKSVSTLGQAPTGSSVTFVNTYTVKEQMTAGKSQTLTLAGYTNVKITNLKLSMKSNKSRGAGGLHYSTNNGQSWTDIIVDSKFNTTNWYGNWSTAYVDIIRSVDIVPNSAGGLVIQIYASANSLYCQSYELTWESLGTGPVTLEGLSIDESSATIFKGYTKQLAVSPIPANADGSVNWSSSNSSVATVDANGLVTGVNIGQATITATSKTNPTIKATSLITVENPLKYTKVTSDADVRFGAIYTIGAQGLYAMDADFNYNYIPRYEAKYETEDILLIEDRTLRFELVPGALENTFGLRELTTGKYLYSNGSTTNDLQLQTTVNELGSYTITVIDNGIDVMITNSSTTDKIRSIRYNAATNGLRFSGYTTTQTPIQLFVDQETLDPYYEAYTLWDYVINGKGNNASGLCNEIQPIMQSVYDRLTAEGKHEFDTNIDFADAKARFDYINMWVSQNSVLPFRNLNKTLTNGFLIIVSVSVVALFTFYLVRKNRRKPVK